MINFDTTLLVFIIISYLNVSQTSLATYPTTLWNNLHSSIKNLKVSIKFYNNFILDKRFFRTNHKIENMKLESKVNPT